MNSLFSQLCKTWRTPLNDEDIISVIQNEYTKIREYEEDYNRRLSSLLWVAIGRQRMEYILSKLSLDMRDIFLHEDVLWSIYCINGIEYMFSFIDKYFSRKFSLLYEYEQPLEISCILDCICQSEDEVKELQRCLYTFNVSSDEFSPGIYSQYY